MDESTIEGHEAEAEGVTDGAERETVVHNGLRSLIWSFICSAVLAVSAILPTKINYSYASSSSLPTSSR